LIPYDTREWLRRGNRDISTINAEEVRALAWQFETEEKRRFCPILRGVKEHCQEVVRDTYNRSGTKDPLYQVLYVYTKMAFAENLLMHGDKHDAHSVELRVPFWTTIVELVTQIPSRYLVRRNKWGLYD
jgi:asparagine synthetase B (glutamine-hydrolysing)